MKLLSNSYNLSKIILFIFILFTLFGQVTIPPAVAQKAPEVFVLKDTLSPSLQVGQEFRSKFGFAYKKNERLKLLLNLTIDEFQTIEKYYASGELAFLRAAFGDLILIVLALERENFEAWKIKVLHELHSFIWEYKKTGRTAETDELFDEIHKKIEKIIGKKLPKIYKRNTKLQLQLISNAI